MDAIAGAIARLKEASIAKQIGEINSAINATVDIAANPAIAVLNEVVLETRSILLSTHPDSLFSSIINLTNVMVASADSVETGITLTTSAWGRIFAGRPNLRVDIADRIAERKAIELIGSAMFIGTTAHVIDSTYSTRDITLNTLEELRTLYNRIVTDLEGMEQEEESSNLTAENKYIVDSVLSELIRNTLYIATSQLLRFAQQTQPTLTHTTQRPQSVITLAFELTGDPERAEQLIADNDIETPELIPTGTTLQYLASEV